MPNSELLEAVKETLSHARSQVGRGKIISFTEAGRIGSEVVIPGQDWSRILRDMQTWIAGPEHFPVLPGVVGDPEEHYAFFMLALGLYNSETLADIRVAVPTEATEAAVRPLLAVFLEAFTSTAFVAPPDFITILARVTQGTTPSALIAAMLEGTDWVKLYRSAQDWLEAFLFGDGDRATRFIMRASTELMTRLADPRAPEDVETIKRDLTEILVAYMESGS